LLLLIMLPGCQDWRRSSVHLQHASIASVCWLSGKCLITSVMGLRVWRLVMVVWPCRRTPSGPGHSCPRRSVR